MKPNTLLSLLLAISLLALNGYIFAETKAEPQIEVETETEEGVTEPTEAETASEPTLTFINFPTNGMDKTEVERLFGAPYEQTDAVGEPPISK